jgi:hypothetical protein
MHYTFLPWLRQGLSSKIIEADTLGTADGTNKERAQLRFDLTLGHDPVGEGQRQQSVITKQVQVAGPGDVLGIERRAIIRTEPRSGVNNYEANLLTYMEFYEEDFPWRYTPAAATGAGKQKLRPWLALIVLKDDEYTFTPNPVGLSHISIKNAAANQVFHKHTEHWAWAHVQINKQTTQTAGQPLRDEMTNLLKNHPEMGISRLFCPRKLVKNTNYHAYLIPAFETGRLAGLGEKTEVINKINSQTPSWKYEAMPAATTRPLDFPVYYDWDFRTGELGDFETLVRKLKPFVVPQSMGTLPMDARHVGVGFDQIAKETQTVPFEAALKPPSFNSQFFPRGPGDSNFVAQLQKFLNLNADMQVTDNQPVLMEAVTTNHPFYDGVSLGDDPIVLPPTIGQHHALVKKLGEVTNPDWIESLNSDLRWRGASGLGNQVVREKQDAFMQTAWKQIGDVNEANKKIIEGQLVKMVTDFMLHKHFKPAPKDSVFALTAPMHRYMLANKPEDARLSVTNSFMQSRVPMAAHSAAFQRITRPEWKTNRTMNQQGVEKIHLNVTSRFNETETNAQFITAATLKTFSPNSISAANATTTLNAAVLNLLNDTDAMARETVVQSLKSSGLTTLSKTTLNNQIDASAQTTEVKTKAKAIVNEMTQLSFNVTTGKTEVEMPPASFKTAFGDYATSRVLEDVIIKRSDEVATAKVIVPIAKSADILQYQQVWSNMEIAINALPDPVYRSKVPDLVSIAGQINFQIQPEQALIRKVSARIWQILGGITKPLIHFKPVMAHPIFKESVYEHLRKISQDYILPNVEKLPKDSVSLMVVNKRFVESFMAGLNHEMARELLWREYPTDQRGTYFRQFWNAKDNTTSSAEAKLDIRKMHQWTGKLGTHSDVPLTGGSGDPEEGNLVLVVRGDLLKKYPDTIVYAQKAKYNPDDLMGERVFDTENVANMRFPLFSGELAPDIYLFGFDLMEDEARGLRMRENENGNPTTPGWFFAFKERPGHTKFGLDDYITTQGDVNATPPLNPPSWDDLAWEYLENDRSKLENFHLNFSKNLHMTAPPLGEPHAVWGSNSADMANILYQDPVLFARHAAELLP